MIDNRKAKIEETLAADETRIGADNPNAVEPALSEVEGREMS